MHIYNLELIFPFLAVLHGVFLVICFLQSDRPVFRENYRRRSRYDLGMTLESESVLCALIINFVVGVILFKAFTEQKSFSLPAVAGLELSGPWVGVWLLCADTVLNCLLIYALFRVNRAGAMLPLLAPVAGGLAGWGTVMYVSRAPEGDNCYPAVFAIMSLYLAAGVVLFIFLLRHFEKPGAKAEATWEEYQAAEAGGDDDSWYDFETSPYARARNISASAANFSDWNSQRFQQFSMTRLPDEVLRSIFVSMGCAGALSTSNVMMQQICFDEIIYQMGLDEKTSARAWEYIRQGRRVLPVGLDAVIAKGVSRLEKVGVATVKSAFSIITGILFYDEILSVAERRLFYDLGRRFGLSKYHADMVFSAHLSVFSMNYDPDTGEYRYQEPSSGGETAGAGNGFRENAGSPGTADEGDIEEQRRQEELRRQEMMRQRREAEERRQERMHQQEKARQEEMKRRQAEFRRQQEEGRRRFQEEQKRREEEIRREQEERRREEESRQKRRRWWWNRTDDEPDDGDMSLAEAYRTLQCGRDDGDEVVRQAWRRLVGRYHPDRAASRGADQEEIARFNAIAARINAAWDVIRKERNL